MQRVFACRGKAKFIFCWKKWRWGRDWTETVPCKLSFALMHSCSEKNRAETKASGSSSRFNATGKMAKKHPSRKKRMKKILRIHFPKVKNQMKVISDLQESRPKKNCKMVDNFRCPWNFDCLCIKHMNIGKKIGLKNWIKGVWGGRYWLVCILLCPWRERNFFWSDFAHILLTDRICRYCYMLSSFFRFPWGSR